MRGFEMTHYDRSSDVILSVLDFGPYNEWMRWGGIIHHGDLYVINSEGVGYNLSTKMNPEIETGWGDTYFNIWEKVVQAEKGQVNLKDLIRQFGDRLENNFSLWNTRLS